MLRLLVVVLVLANLFFLAWARGWLSPMWPPPRHGEREPERLLAQVTPERVRVLPAPATAQAAPAPPGAVATASPTATSTSTPASTLTGAATATTAPAPATVTAATAATAAAAAAPAPRAAADQCLEAGPFAPSEVAAAAAALVQAGVPATRWVRVVSPGATAPWLVYAGRFADLKARQTMLQEWRRLGLAVELMDAPAEWAPGLVLSRHPSRDTAEVALSGLPDNVSQVARVVPTPSAAQPSLLRVAAADAALAARLLSLPPPLQGSFRACAASR